MAGLKLFAPVPLALLALTPFAWTAVPQASYLVHLEVKTDNGLNSGLFLTSMSFMTSLSLCLQLGRIVYSLVGMDSFGSIDVRIYNENDGFCEILKLDSSDNNFENGDLDVFYVDELKNCFLFYIPDNNVTKVTVQHHGSDAWLPEYFQMHMDPSAVVQCNDGEWIDNEELHTITNCAIV